MKENQYNEDGGCLPWIVLAFVLLAIAVGVGLNSCAPVFEDRQAEECPVVVTCFSYKGCNYIRFGLSDSSPILHDPKCPCRNSE